MYFIVPKQIEDYPKYIVKRPTNYVDKKLTVLIREPKIFEFLSLSSINGKKNHFIELERHIRIILSLQKRKCSYISTKSTKNIANFLREFNLKKKKTFWAKQKVMSPKKNVIQVLRNLLSLLTIIIHEKVTYKMGRNYLGKFDSLGWFFLS